MSDTEITALVLRMARREASAHCLIAPEQPPGVIRPPAPPVAVRLVPCPDAGAEPVGEPPQPFANWFVSDDATLPALSMFACEWLAPRAVLPLAVLLARDADGIPTRRFRTRAAARADQAADAALASSADPLAWLDGSEEWVDDLVEGRAVAPSGVLTLPTVSRALGGSIDALPVGPHAPAWWTGELTGRYLAARAAAATSRLMGA